MTKISVIVPVFNVETYLDKCIQSLIQQTLQDIEIICVDDCSTDNSYKILKKYATIDKRIKVLQTPKNSGQSTARNIGLNTARAKYIMFCDSDDWYEPTMCQDMLQLIITNNADLGLCSVKVVYETDSTLKNVDKKLQLPDACFDITNSKTQNLAVGAPLRIIKKSIIKKYDITFPSGLKYEDVYFSNVYNLYVRKIATTSKQLYNYRRRNGSTMNTTFSGKSKSTADQALIAIRYLSYLKKHNLYTQEYFNFWTTLFISCAQNSLMFTKNKKNAKELDNTLINFISKNYIFGTTTPYTDYIISLILDKVFMRRKKYLGGLIQIYHETTKTEWCLGKLCIFKIKHFESYQKYYLFGIYIYKKDNK